MCGWQCDCTVKVLNENQILLNIECSELKKLVDFVMKVTPIHQVLGLIVTTRKVILISYFSFHQPWLPHPTSLRL